VAETPPSPQDLCTEPGVFALGLYPRDPTITTMSTLAVGYARVSTEGEDIENQVHAIEDYAKTNNLTLVGVFRDVGVSGAKPALEREG